MPEEPQDERLVSYAPRLRKEEAGWTGTSPPAPCTTTSGACTRGRTRSRGPARTPILPVGRRRRDGEAGVEPGTILAAGGDQLLVATGAGVLVLLELQAEGGRVLPARAFLAGHPLAPGERLGAP